MKVKKVIIPAAGFGTRFLPFTKAIPKEMLPIVDKPVIEYVVADAISAGVKDIIIVTNWNKRAIEDHFDYPFELMKKLEEWSKSDLIPQVTEMVEAANFIYLRQKGPYGNSIPVKNARHLVDNEPFLVFFGDEFIEAEPSRSKQLIETFEKYNAPVLSCLVTEKPEDGKRYGYAVGKEVEEGVIKVESIVEKPGEGKAPSKYSLVGGYLLMPDIFEVLETQKPGTGGEYYLAEALNELLLKRSIYARIIKNGVYRDTGNKIEYLKTMIDIALNRDDIGDELREYLREKL